MIASGELSPGNAVYSERALMERLGSDVIVLDELTHEAKIDAGAAA